VIEQSVERTKAPRTLEGDQASPPRKRGTCAGCGSTTKALIAPRKNLRSYTGPMHCLSCSPRFSGGGIDELLKRMGG